LSVVPAIKAKSCITVEGDAYFFKTGLFNTWTSLLQSLRTAGRI
jgi:hypothetical protein